MHISAVEKAGPSGLNEGAKVSYEDTSKCGKSSAENLSECKPAGACRQARRSTLLFRADKPYLF